MDQTFADCVAARGDLRSVRIGKDDEKTIAARHDDIVRLKMIFDERDGAFARALLQTRPIRAGAGVNFF